MRGVKFIKLPRINLHFPIQTENQKNSRRISWPDQAFLFVPLHIPGEFLSYGQLQLKSWVSGLGAVCPGQFRPS